MSLVAAAAALLALPVAMAAESGQAPSGQEPPLVVEITSPLGRTGLPGAIRIVARITSIEDAPLSLIRFYVDGETVGDDTDGPPYAVEWVDENPFAAREIVVDVQDLAGNTARDTVKLDPLEIVDATYVSSVRLEPAVLDETGKSIAGLEASDFTVFEDGVPQVLDMAAPDEVPATFTLLIDSSQSMSRRMEFVRLAARQLPGMLREKDSVLVAPFQRRVGVVTGPTQDMETINDAIAAIEPSGGTAILDSLSEIATQLNPLPGRQAIVLITDGYDEHSELVYDRTIETLKTTNVTV